MSPVDSFSPANPEAYPLTGFTPYNTTSPAYAGAMTQPGMSAASPISAALAHGSRVLSNIQPSPMYGTPSISQPYPGRFVGQQQQQQQQQRPPASPQPGSPEYLRLAIQHLQTTLLTRLEAEAESYFDAVDSSFAVEADTRVVAQKARAFEMAMEGVMDWVEKNGLASIPILPAPSGKSQEAGATAGEATPTIADPAAKQEPTKEEAEKKVADQTAKEDDAGAKLSLEQEISLLQQQAKDLFDRRQRLKESASIVTGILDS